jgi:hypothetical protein
MRNKILVVGGIAFLAYILGSRAARGRTVKGRESVGHQVVRLWNKPQAKKSRRKIAKSTQETAGRAAKAGRRKAHDLKKKLT